MEYRRQGQDIVLRLDRGEELVQSLLTLAEKENIVSASLQGLGATDNATLGVFDLSTKIYHKTNLLGAMEIANVCGNLSRQKGKPYLHAHITLGHEDGKVYAGHLNDALISVTAEIWLHVTDIPVDRKQDPEIGINLIEF